jgi:hypothetical protein
MNIHTTPGLLKVYVVHRDDSQVVVNEEWDIRVPGCPMIRNPWAQQLGWAIPSGNHYIRQLTLTPEEAKEYFGPNA